MKTLTVILLALGFTLQANAQETLSKAEIRRFQKEQKKLEKEREAELKAEITKQLVNTQQFVLEADWLSDRYGNRVPVTSTINFIMVDSTEGVMQLGSAHTYGYNGVGGSTIEGRISRYQVKMMGKRKEAYSIRWSLNTALGTYDISLVVSGNGSADATIRSNWSGSINYHGDLVPLAQARIFKGTPLY